MTALVRARGYSFEFPVLLANHAPMVAVALQRLGAGPERVAQWIETYAAANGLVPPPPPVAPIARDGWDEALGQRSREADYRAFFVGETRRLGVGGAIDAYLPRLVQGVAGSALHPLMRLAYAVSEQERQDVGVALGYWAACHLPLPAPSGSAPDTDDPGEVLAGVAGVEGARACRPETHLLWHNIRAVAELPGFAPVIDRLRFRPDTPQRMAATALALYAGTMDFAALHAVTGLHWVRLVAPHLADAEPLYRAFWQAVAALVPIIGFPELPTTGELAAMRARSAPGWRDIHAAAVRSDDEHDISLTFSAWREEARWGDPLYRVVAARRLQLID